MGPMKLVSWVFMIFFVVALLGATLSNLGLIDKSREALSTGVFRDKSTIKRARSHVIAIIPDSNDSFHTQFLSGLNEEAGKMDVAVQVFAYKAMSPEEARRWFELAIHTGANGIIMYLGDHDSLIHYAQAAAEQGVIFIPFGPYSHEDSAWGFIGSSAWEQGYRAGAIISERLGDFCRVGLILPPVTTHNQALTDGLSAALAKFPGARISGTVNVKQEILGGEEAAISLLRNHPDINALFCPNMQDTLGAAQVIIELNLVGKVLIIGSDEGPELSRFIEKGVVAASIVRDARVMGIEAIKSFSWRNEGLSPSRDGTAPFLIQTGSGGKQ